MNGKGDTQRPARITQREYAERYAQTFRPIPHATQWIFATPGVSTFAFDTMHGPIPNDADFMAHCIEVR